MANIIDYLSWRGDLSFRCSEFNEVDNLILSELIYVDFHNIVPGIGEGDISLEKASELFFMQHTDEEINAKVSSTKVAAFLMRDMAVAERFSNIRLANYVNDIDLQEQSQFCAMTVQLGDGRICIVFSGTDSTIVGWKENFNMSFLSETPGQVKATEYLQWVAGQYEFPIRVMGHSKGGNLSVYAATHVNREIMDRIEVIYSNDGPGFSESMIAQDNYSYMIPKIRTIIPESSIVGMLLEHEEEFEVVKSCHTGASQHDVMSWEVIGTHLVHLNKVDGKSVLLDKTLKSWVYNMEPSQREAFVDTLFGVLDAANIHTVDELAKTSPLKLLSLITWGSALDKSQQEIIKDTIKSLLEEWQNVWKSEIFGK